MKKYLWLLLIPFLLVAAAPSRQTTYVTGEVITTTDVNSNEDEIFDYLQTGVEVIATDAVNDTHIDWGTGSDQVSQDDVVNGSTYKQYNPASVAITGGSVIGITDLLVADGGTGASSLADGYVLLGSGTGAITPLNVTTDGDIIVGDGTTDPTTLTAFTSSTGTLKHESGGLEADISGYTSGLYGMAAGVTTDIDTSAEVAAAIGDETGTTLMVFNTSPTLVTPVLGAATATSLNASGTVTGVVVSASGAIQVGSDYISDITGSGLSVSGGALTVTTTGESTTVSDTTTIDLTLTAYDITADGLYTAGDHLTLTLADFDVDDDFVLNTTDSMTGSLTVGNTVTGLVVDSQRIEYSGGQLTFNDTTTGVKTLAQLAAGGGTGDLKADGTVPLTADWNAGNSLYDITAVEFKGALIGQANTVATITGLAPDTQNTYARTQYLIPYASTTTAFGEIAIGTATHVLTSGGAGAVASFQVIPTQGAHSLAATLAIGADANDLDITSMDKLEGVDPQVYIDLGTDGKVILEADTEVEITSPCEITGLLTLTSGQIAFPATAVPSANANTLDDYEEGTWTPSVGGDATYTARVARYTKIGDVVHVYCDITINAIGTGSTTTLSGLPFSGAASIYQAGAIYAYINSASDTIWMGCYVNAGNVWFEGSHTSGASSNDNINVFGNATRVLFTVTYFI